MKNIHLPSKELYIPYEVELHYKRPLYQSMISIHSSKDSNDCLRTFINTKRLDFKEFFWVLLLNRNNRLLAFSKVGTGGQFAVLLNVGEIIKLALLSNACSIVLAHNHPSGGLEASNADIKITKRITEAAELFDITIIDHLIITSESYYSFADNGYFS